MDARFELSNPAFAKFSISQRPSGADGTRTRITLTIAIGKPASLPNFTDGNLPRLGSYNPFGASVNPRSEPVFGERRNAPISPTRDSQGSLMGTDPLNVFSAPTLFGHDPTGSCGMWSVSCLFQHSPHLTNLPGKGCSRNRCSNQLSYRAVGKTLAGLEPATLRVTGDNLHTSARKPLEGHLPLPRRMTSTNQIVYKP